MKRKLIIVIIVLLVAIGACSAILFDEKRKETIRLEEIAEQERLAKIEEEKRIKEEEEKQKLIKEEENKKKLEEAGIKFDEAINAIALENDVTGMSIAIFKGDKIIHTTNYGYADKENKIETNNNTKYRIASISKLVTTIGLMRLYDDNRFKLDDYIYDITGINYDSKYGRVTFKNLLTHTAGISDYSNAYASACNGSRLTVDDVIKGSHMNVDVGTYYQYSNLGLSSVGAIIEKLTGEYFGDYMRQLFEELNIDAAYSSDYITDKESIARLYDGSGMHNVQTWFKTSDWYKSYGLGNSYLQGDGELIISASDLAKIGMIMAGDGSLNGVQVLKPETVRLMETDTVDSYEEGKYRYTEGLSCHNFKTLLEGREIHGHTGSALGVVTALYFDPTDQTGVVILDNHALNRKDENNRTHVLYDTLKEAYDDYFSKNMLDIYE